MARYSSDGWRFCLAVKENQPRLYAEIAETFVEAADARKRTADEAPRPKVSLYEETDKGHGRIEQRTLEVCRDLTWMTTADRWRGMTFVARVTRQRTQVASGETSMETSYYIGSANNVSPAHVAKQIRRHWAIENERHWVLDMAFREDEARHRADNLAQNMTTLRHAALNILSRDPKRKLGIANSRKRAGWDHAYLLSLITQA